VPREIPVIWTDGRPDRRSENVLSPHRRRFFDSGGKKIIELEFHSRHFFNVLLFNLRNKHHRKLSYRRDSARRLSSRRLRSLKVIDVGMYVIFY